MGVVIGGRELGVEHNGVFSTRNTDPIPGGRLWPEAAAAWNAARIAAIADGVPPEEFMPAGPASSARKVGHLGDWPPPESGTQHYFRGLWCSRGECGKAAVPGTSNHGWGIAVDVLGPRAQAWLRKHGMKYGWSWDEGRRIGEPWHFRYVGGYRKREHPLRGLNRDERRWVRELDELRARGHDLQRRRVLVRTLTQRRKHIWREAEGERRGWDKYRRRRRYRVLLSRTR